MESYSEIFFAKLVLEFNFIIPTLYELGTHFHVIILLCLPTILHKHNLV